MTQLEKGLIILFDMAKEESSEVMASTILRTCEEHQVSLEQYISDFAEITERGRDGRN